MCLRLPKSKQPLINTNKERGHAVDFIEKKLGTSDMNLESIHDSSGHKKSFFINTPISLL